MSSNIKDLIEHRELAKYVDLLPGFIHNLNTPLMNISGRAELIQYKQPGLKGPDEILNQLDNINNIINNLNYMMKLERTLTPEKIKLLDFFESFHEFLRLNMSYKHNIKTIKEIDSELYLTTIPNYLLNIFYEIFSDSINNMNGGETITVKVYPEEDKMYFDIRRGGNSFTDRQFEEVNDDYGTESSGEILSSLRVAKYLIESLDGTLNIKNLVSEQQYLFTITIY